MNAVPMEGPVKGRIERKIPRPSLLINDRSHLPGPCVGGIFAPLISNLVGKAEANRPVPRFGHPHPWTDVVADPVPSLAILRGSEHVRARLERIREAGGNFYGLVHLMIGGKQPVLERL